ncbi:protein aurora borealis [Episyrphus balteatus]|uniref:protein aurora borealis n=1 Tax=Episyrphus balteatus TaxID=286459 RepID=UPI0024859229|nr:protein aurora borealis [Episyrphus balteatus]
MNSLDNTPLRYKNRSPMINFFSKNLGKTNQSTTLMTHGHHSRRFRETNSFDVFPVLKTPPTKRFAKVVNPFEAALSDRLHLPIIASPTLFQRPPTPQHSSTQFAWTIDDVSSLQPANVEPHETQFHDSPDPEFEAKAQSAISSFFKEQQIVPSPIDCPLRSQRIILSEITGNTPISKPGRRIRDNAAQTVLSLPPTLPKDLEAALAPYFTFNECQQSTSNLADSSISAIEYDIRDASLRRKLFDYQGVSCMDDDTCAEVERCQLTSASPPPQSPEVLKCKSAKFDDAFFKSRLSDPMDKSSFGSLSPIAQNSSSPETKHRSRINFKNEVATTSRSGYFYENYRCPKVEDFASPLAKKSPMYLFTTPERSSVHQLSSPYRLASAKSDTAFNIKISGLLVDTTKRSRASAELDLFADDTQDIDEDEMQVSQLSAISNISSESDTPRSKRRSTSRKNLSQSFTNQFVSSNEDENNVQLNDSLEEANKIFVPTTNLSAESNAKQTHLAVSERSILYRTDSGFNEMTTSCSQQYDTKPNFQLSGEEEDEEDQKTANGNACDADISMICCSTPSKHSVAIP